MLRMGRMAWPCRCGTRSVRRPSVGGTLVEVGTGREARGAMVLAPLVVPVVLVVLVPAVRVGSPLATGRRLGLGGPEPPPVVAVVPVGGGAAPRRRRHHHHHRHSLCPSCWGRRPWPRPRHRPNTATATATAITTPPTTATEGPSSSSSSSSNTPQLLAPACDGGPTWWTAERQPGQLGRQQGRQQGRHRHPPHQHHQQHPHQHQQHHQAAGPPTAPLPGP